MSRAGDARIPAAETRTAGMLEKGADRTDGSGPRARGLELELNRAGWAASARGPKANLESGCRSWHGITNWQTVTAGIGWLARPQLCSHVGRLSGWVTYRWDLNQVAVGGPRCPSLGSWRRNRCAGTVKLDSLPAAAGQRLHARVVGAADDAVKPERTAKFRLWPFSSLQNSNFF